MAAKKYSDWKLLARLLRQARPYWPHLVVLLVLSLLAMPLALLLPLPLAMVVDGLAGSDPIPGFVRPLLPEGAAISLANLIVLAAFLLVGVSLLDQVQKLATSV